MASQKDNLREFVLEEANKLLEDSQIAKLVEVKTSSLPFKINGNIKFSLGFNEAQITFNLLNLLKSSPDITKVYFNAYSTIVHEITHAKLILTDSANPEFKFAKLMTILEYLYYGSYFKVYYKKTQLNPVTAFNIQKLLNLNYDISAAELFANWEGYKKSLEKFKDGLSADDIKNYTEIIKALEFLNKQMQVFYLLDRTVVNKFSTFLLGAQKYLKKYPELFEKYPICTSIFNSCNSLIHPYYLYLKINEENKAFYDQLLINLIISFKIDITSFLKDEKFKKYLEELIKKYIDETILYYDNIHLGKIFIKNGKNLNDNFRFKKFAIVLLQEFAARNGLNIEGGIVLDSSIMMSSENLVRKRHSKNNY